MKKKLRNILWLALLLLLCFPVGYMAMIISKPNTLHRDQLPISIAIAVILFLLFGLISWLVYYFAKRRNAKDPSRTALIVFSCLIAAGILGNSPNLNKALRERDRYDFIRGFRESMSKGFDEQIKTNPDVPDEVKQHTQEISDCIYYKFKANDKLVDEAMAATDPENFAMTSPDMRKIVEGCMKIYLPIK